ncbi:MAG: cytochrome c biogenesis protein CcdA [Bacillota bacterium]|jgi:cytochrome c-type biogenesis protein
MIDQLLQVWSELMQETSWLAPLLALLAGMVTSVTPCALSSIPLVIGYVGGAASQDSRRAFSLSLVFALGMAVSFTVLGTLAALLGQLLHVTGSWWYIFLGVLMVMMALQTWEVFNFIPSTYLTSRNTRRGFIGALFTGVLAGVFSSPCATPVLVVLLAIVAQGGNILWGILLLLLYSVGHSILVLVAGTSFGLVRRITGSGKYGTFSAVLKYVTGAVILLIGFYMFYLGF